MRRIYKFYDFNKKIYLKMNHLFFLFILAFQAFFYYSASASEEVRDSDPFEHNHNIPFDASKHAPGEPLSPVDFQNAEDMNFHGLRPSNDQQELEDDPIELAGLYEGDIVISPALVRNRTRSQEEDGNGESEPFKNAIIKDEQKWSRGVIPYIIEANFDPFERSVIAQAFLEYQRHSCIIFTPRTTETDYIYLVKGHGCSSHVGKLGGQQLVTLGNGCVFTGIVIHELLHACGFWHEQSRWDRDDYVTIYYDNIPKSMHPNFNKYSWKYIQSLDTEYDIGSIMHYGVYAFAKDKKKPSILPKDPNDKMGQRENFSKTDLMKLNRLYNCQGGSNPPPPPAESSSTTTEITPTIATAETKCADNHEYCLAWSKQGECDKNSSWMTINCKKSCQKCNSKCADLNASCPNWAKGGECTRNSDYMMVYCPLSCNNCKNSSSGQSPCKDDNKFCLKWAENGECSKNPNWMLKHCRKSCGRCISYNIE